MVCGSKPFSASLSRILAELLGGTRSSPPEAPSRKFGMGFQKNTGNARCGLPGNFLFSLALVVQGENDPLGQIGGVVADAL